MSDDLVSYRELDDSHGNNSGRSHDYSHGHSNGQTHGLSLGHSHGAAFSGDGRANGSRSNGGSGDAAAPRSPATPRFFVRPGAETAPVTERGPTARPIQAPGRPRPSARKTVPEGWPEVPVRPAALRTLRLLAFNAELRPSVALDSELVEGRPHGDARFDALVQGLKTQDADIVVLQEVYDPQQVDKLRHIFRNRYPNVAFKAPGREARLGCGHVILSNRPFADMRFEPMRGGLEPRGLIEKGMLITRISLPNGAIRLATFQGCAAGIAERMARHDNAGKREKFGRQILRSLMEEDEREPLLVVGDLSSGPDYRPELFDMLARSGFADAVEQADETMRVTGNAGVVPPPRPDWRPQVFARVPKWSGVYFSAWRTYFDENVVAVSSGVRIPLAQRPAIELLMDIEPN